jgi:hypothetical protein
MMIRATFAQRSRRAAKASPSRPTPASATVSPRERQSDPWSAFVVVDLERSGVAADRGTMGSRWRSREDAARGSATDRRTAAPIRPRVRLLEPETRAGWDADAARPGAGRANSPPAGSTAATGSGRASAPCTSCADDATVDACSTGAAVISTAAGADAASTGAATLGSATGCGCTIAVPGSVATTTGDSTGLTGGTAGSAGRAGRNASGSRYPCGSLVVRTPK